MALKLFDPIIQYWRKRTGSLSATARRSLYISLGLHLALLFSAGAIVISHIFYNRESTFKGTPPPPKAYDPRQLEFKVRVTKQARSSSRPSLAPRMVSSKAGLDLALPEIKVDAKVIKTSFQSKFKAVSGRGIGAGLGTGYGTAGFGVGVSSVNFFGIQARGEKVAILMDVSVSMVEEEKGGPAGYARVKQRCEEVMDALSDGSLFNAIVFADAASAFTTNLVIASTDNRSKAKLFIRQFNTEGNYGLSQGNLSPSEIGLKAYGGTTRLDLALTAAFEQGADTILVISDGAPKVKRGYTADQLSAFRAKEEQWYQAHAADVRAWEADRGGGGGGGEGAEKIWIPPTPARPPGKAPLKEGVQADPGAPAIEGHWQVVRNGGRPKPQAPPIPDPGFWSLTDFLQHLAMLHQKLYLEKGKKPPVIHCIGYQIDKEGHNFLMGLAKAYHGDYRRVKALR